VFFVCVASVMSSIRAEDIARYDIPYGDFRLALDYVRYDAVYPENNLDSLARQDFFNEGFLEEIAAIDGVEKVTRNRGQILSSIGDVSQSYLYEDHENRVDISYFTREDVETLEKELKRGELDYDRMTANNEICFGEDHIFEAYGLELGDVFEMTLYDGDRQIPFTGTLTASTAINDISEAEYATFLVTEDTWNSLGLAYDTTTSFYIEVQEERYEEVKAALMEMAEENPRFILYCMDVEMMIGRSSVSAIRYPVYLILILIAVIGFMNLFNTMIVSVVTRKKELGILQAVGLSPKQLARMLSGEGLVFTAGTLIISLTLGNLCGYGLFRYAVKVGFMGMSRYHYPLVETVGLAVMLLLGQGCITLFLNRKVAHGSLIERIRSEE